MSKKVKTRDLAESRKVILSVAFREIFARGFQGVSIDDIVKKTPYSKGAFYHQFATKWDLGYALVEEVISPMILERWIDPLKNYDDPIEGVLIQLQRLIGDVDLKLLRLGCPLNNLVQEMSPIDKGFQMRLEKALGLWVDRLDKQFKRGQKNGYIKKTVATRDLAYFVVMAHEGFYGIIKGMNSKEVFPALLNSLENYLYSVK